MKPPGLSTEILIFDERIQEVVGLPVGARLTEEGLVATRLGVISALGLSAYLAAEGLKDDIKFDCGLTLRREQGIVEIDSQPIPDPLSKLEFSVLEVLACRPDHVHSTKSIQLAVWGDEIGCAGLVTTPIGNIRLKLGAQLGIRGAKAGPNVGLVETFRKRGYKMGERAFMAEPLIFPGS